MIVPGLTGATATAINNRGDITGYGAGNTGTASFLSSGENFTLLSVPGSMSTMASGINDSRDIVGTYTDNAGSHGFKYSAGTYTTIDAPPPALPNTTSLNAINNIGQIAGNATVVAQGTTTSATDGFVDTAGTFGFEPTGAGESFSLASLNGMGNIVGNADGVPGVPAYGTESAFTLNHGIQGTFTSVNDAGAVTLIQNDISYLLPDAEAGESIAQIFFPNSNGTRALGMNNAGMVVGSYFDSSGTQQAFVAAPQPVAPTCIITSSSPPLMIFTVQDSAGLGSIGASRSLNANVNIPSFVSGTTAAIVVTASAVNPAFSASVTLEATNANGTAASGCAARISGGGASWLGLGGVLTSNAGVTPDFNGGLDAFGLGSDSALWHIAQSVPAGPWGSWLALGGGPFQSDPVVVLSNFDLLERAFEVSANGTLWYISQIPVQFQAPTWSGATWSSLGSGFKGRPAVINNANRDLQVFVRTSNDSISTLTQSSPGSSNWNTMSLGGVVTSNPAVALDGAGTVQVVATGTDQALWVTGVTSQGTVMPFSSTGGSLKGDPSMVARGGELYAFGRGGGDDAVWFNFKQGTQWESWQSLGGVIVNNPKAILNSDGRAEVFVAGTDNGVWHAAQTVGGGDQWSQWSSLGGIISGDVIPALDASSAVNLFVIGADQGLWTMTQPLPGFWH